MSSNTKRGRPANSGKSDYLRTPAISEWRDRLATMTTEELLHVAYAARQRLADESGRADEARVRSHADWYAACCALDAADLRCRRVERRPLLTTADYRRHAPAGAPSLSTLYRRFGPTWEHILARAGIASASNPLVLNIPAFAPGRNGATGKGQDRYSEDEKNQAFAYAIEQCAGRKPTRKQYDRVAELAGPGFPAYTAVIKRGSEELKLDECYRRAVPLIMQNPDAYPLAYGYLLRRGR